MKKIIYLLSFFLVIPSLSFSQAVKSDQMSNKIIPRRYNKEVSEYKAKEFIIDKVLNIPNGELIPVKVDALTASKSGELSTLVYDCKEMGKKGIVFSFWQREINEYNTRYNGYAFKNIDYEEAKDLFVTLDRLIKEKKDIVKLGPEWNAAFRWDDLLILFYKEGASNKIRVFWNGFDAEWNQANLKTTIRRFTKS
jgi:hypothetical protein